MYAHDLEAGGQALGASGRMPRMATKSNKSTRADLPKPTPDPRLGKSNKRVPASELRFAQLLRGNPLEMYPPEAWDRFLQIIAETANVSRAARETGIERVVAYERRNNDPEFAELWDKARATAFIILEGEAHRRAYEGTEKPVIYQGQQCYTAARDEDGNPILKDGNPVLVPLTINEKSDQLLMFLLTGNDKRYARKQEITGAGGGPLAVGMGVADMTPEQLNDFIRTQQALLASGALADIPDDPAE